MGQLKQKEYQIDSISLAAHIFDVKDKVLKDSLMSFFSFYVGFDKYVTVDFYNSTIAYLLEHELAVETA